VTSRDPNLASGELDRFYALEDETRQLRRDLDGERRERRALEARVQLVAERLAQAEEDVKDAHDRVQNTEDRLEVLEREPLEEREHGESGA
jgi:hypothetical protein